MLKKFEMDESKAISTPMGTSGSLDSDASGNMVDQKMYRSMIGSLLYVTASRPDVTFSVCMCTLDEGHFEWLWNQVQESAIAMWQWECNQVNQQSSSTCKNKALDVRHHFIRDHQQKGNICIESVGTEDQLADIFTKPLDEKRFCKLRNELNILDFLNMCWHVSPSSNPR